MSSIVKVVSVTREQHERFARSTYLGRSLSRFPASAVPALMVLFENGAEDGRPHGLPEVYNAAISQAGDDDILLFAHDDVYIHDWFLEQRLTEALARFDVVGIAGSANPNPDFPGWALQFDDDLRPMSWQDGIVMSGVVNHHDYGVPAPYAFGPAPMECELLDGLFLASRARTLRSASVRFDERFAFHLYDLDFCRAARASGLRLGTWPIAVTHGSGGGYDTEAFRSAARLYLEKWKAVA